MLFFLKSVRGVFDKQLTVSDRRPMILTRSVFDGQNYRKGERTTIEFTLKGHTLTIGERAGSFKGMLENRTFRLVFFDGKKTINKKVEYSGMKITASI